MRIPSQSPMAAATVKQQQGGACPLGTRTTWPRTEPVGVTSSNHVRKRQPSPVASEALQPLGQVVE